MVKHFVDLKVGDVFLIPESKLYSAPVIKGQRAMKTGDVEYVILGNNNGIHQGTNWALKKYTQVEVIKCGKSKKT